MTQNLRLFLHFFSAALLLPIGTNPVRADSPAPAASPAPAGSAGVEADHSPNIEDSKETFQRELEAAEKSGDKARLWSALMGMAWFDHETGRSRESIELSNRALEIGSELNNPFMIGRSLDWLGWAYSSLGMYELAEQFYTNAVEVGAPGGKVQHVAVWGLGLQELGALHFKMGRLDQAKKELEETTNFARTNGIDVGVAEGSAHLAELALAEGRLSDAETLAAEALAASLRCNCSPFNTARAQLMVAKIAWGRAKIDPAREPAARKLIEEALNRSEQSGVRTIAAESRLLAAHSIPVEQFQKRYDLVREAFETLESLEQERRGSAEAQLGRVLLDNDQTEMAEQYIKHGYKVNREMFRKIDNAYILGDLATIRGLSNDRAKMYKDLEAAAKRAEKMGTLPTALEMEQRLAAELERDGYDSLALDWAVQGLKTAQKLIEREKDPAAQHPFRTAEAALMEQIVSLEVRLNPAEHKKSPAEQPAGANQS